MIIWNKNGTAMVFSLLVIVVLLTFGSIFVVRSINEWQAVNWERRLSKGFYISEAGGDDGLLKVDELINTHLRNTINDTNPQVLGNRAQGYADDGDGLGFLVDYAKDGGTSLLTLDGSGTKATYTQSSLSLGDGDYQYDIVFEEASDPVNITAESWDFPYKYRINSTGDYKGTTRKISLIGDFTVRVQKDNFAKYALFTDHHGMPSGDTVWFTDKTNFAGPIHTNDQYSFAFNPSGIFDGEVTQHNKNAEFYNNGSPFTDDVDSNPGIDVPIFNEGFERGVNEIVLASSVQKQDLYDHARGGETTTGNGIFVVNDSVSLTGGIYVRGNSTIQMSVADGGDDSVYTITEGATTKIITVDNSGNQTTINEVGVGITTYNGLPDGMYDLGTIIYVDGYVTSLSGTVQKDTEVTISAENDVVISNDIMYSDYTPAVGSPGDAGYVPPNATGATNMLGVLAWGGDIRIGTTAPDDIDVHGIMMARNGVFTVDDYDDQGVGSRGTTTLLGGAITQFYGAFGLFNGATGQQISGYGRNFVYDSRTLLGQSPPYFPTMKAFIAFTNDITDKIVFQEGGF